MTKLLSICLGVLGAFVVMNLAQVASADVSQIEQEVANVERAFAQSMADRDFAAFASFLDDEAVFWGGKTAARGKQAVMDAWRPLYEGDAAPFSWEPELVLATASGDMALSTGPVYAPDGSIAGYYRSTWRLNEAGEWKIIFDKGEQYCPPKAE